MSSMILTNTVHSHLIENNKGLIPFENNKVLVYCTCTSFPEGRSMAIANPFHYASALSLPKSGAAFRHGSATAIPHFILLMYWTVLKSDKCAHEQISFSFKIQLAMQVDTHSCSQTPTHLHAHILFQQTTPHPRTILFKNHQHWKK